MAPKRTLWCVIVCSFAVILLASCESVHVYRTSNHGVGQKVGHGLPAHAKAHGYRRKQAFGYDLVYDSHLGVYIVVGLSDCYYHDGHFYRFCSNHWESSLRANTGWSPIVRESLPLGLRDTVKAKGNIKGYARAQDKLKRHAKVKR